MAERLALFFLFFPLFLFSLSFHEAAHAWTANRLGDPTARLRGRMTLNPLAHIDWIGTVLFPLLMFLAPGLLLFGWAKPVPINPYHLRGGRGGALRVALAGPLSNLLLALLFAMVFRGMVGLFPPSPAAGIFFRILESGVYLNLILSFFNLIPIPPLDGSQVLEGLLSESALEGYRRFSRYGFLLLFAALSLGVLRYLAIPVEWVAEVLLP